MIISLSSYINSDQNFNSLLGSIYMFGLLSLAGFYAVYPGGTKIKNEWGDKVKTGNMFNLSRSQVIIFLAWFLIFGAYLVYRI